MFKNRNLVQFTNLSTNTILEFIMNAAACGRGHTFCLDSSGNLWGFGNCECGQLGNGESANCNYPKQIKSISGIISVSCGALHTICCDIHGNAYGFGNNNSGQLGIEESKSGLNPSIIKFNESIQIKQVSAGNYFSLFLDSNCKVWCCGSNIYGQLGLGSILNQEQLFPCKITIEIENINFESIHAGGQFVILKDYEGSIWSCGDNEKGQLGLRDRKDRMIFEKVPFHLFIDCVSCGFDFTLFLENNNVWGFGSNFFGQIGLEDEKDTVIPLQLHCPKSVSVSAGFNSSAIITEDGLLFVCGANDLGQLGLHDFCNRNKMVENKNIKDVVSVSHGGFHRLVKDINGNIWVFGSNISGQLGTFSETTICCKPFRLHGDLNHIIGSKFTLLKSATK